MKSKKSISLSMLFLIFLMLNTDLGLCAQYRVIFPYKEPVTTSEKMLFNLYNGDPVKYMKALRLKEGVLWSKALADLYLKPFNISKWKDLIKNSLDTNLTPYIPREDISIFQMSSPHYQGTRVLAEPILYQETASGKLIRISDPDALDAEENMKRVRAARKGKTFTNSIGMKFVSIPAGSFMMGNGISPSQVARKYGGKAGWYEDEYPQHRVTISKPLYIQTTEVTQGQWQSIMGRNPSHFKSCGDNCPVEKVSWNDAQEFIRRLNQKESTNKYRLPTEAEWEYACRAGSTTRFCFGNNDSGLTDYVWYRKNSNSRTHPIAQKTPNAWGLYDMHGNVWEWCQDWYKKNYPAGQVTDPKGPSSGTYRVFRGGGWYSFAGFCRSAVRDGCGPADRRYDYGGFRVARDF